MAKNNSVYGWFLRLDPFIIIIAYEAMKMCGKISVNIASCNFILNFEFGCPAIIFKMV